MRAAGGARLERAESGGAFATSQRGDGQRRRSSQGGVRPAAALEFGSLLAEPGPGAAAAGPLQPGALAASLELRYPGGPGAWLTAGPASGGGALGGSGRGGGGSGGALGEDASLVSHSLAAKSDSETSRSSMTPFAAAAGGGGGGAPGGGGASTAPDSVTSSGGWGGLGLGLGLPGLGLGGLGLPGLSGLGLGGLTKGPSFGLGRVSKEAPSAASWDDGIGLPMPPSSSAPSLGAGRRGGRGGGPAAGGASGGFGRSGLPRGVSGDDLMSPAIRALVTRPELALCLLTEVRSRAPAAPRRCSLPTAAPRCCLLCLVPC
jgi:hypothetical protein